VAAKLRQRLSVCKRVAQTFDMQRFEIRKLNYAEVKGQCQVKVTNRFAVLENFDDNVDMNRVWEKIRVNIKISAKESLGHYELQQQKTWFDDECSKLIDRRKQDKLQRLQNPSKVNGDNMDNVRREGNRTFRTKRRENLENKINELETNIIIRILETCTGV
jgi:DNA anti-recombination protein RmuC